MATTNGMTATANGLTDQIGKIVTIDNFWGTKFIPAILRNVTCNFEGYSEVWIPEGYEDGSGGYSMRKQASIQVFTGTDDVRNDVWRKWEQKQSA